MDILADVVLAKTQRPRRKQSDHWQHVARRWSIFPRPYRMWRSRFRQALLENTADGRIRRALMSLSVCRLVRGLLRRSPTKTPLLVNDDLDRQHAFRYLSLWQ